MKGNIRVYEETGDRTVAIFVYPNPLPLEAIQNVTINSGWQRYDHGLKQILLDDGCVKVHNAMLLKFVRETVCSQVIERYHTNGNF